jgi:hypothetical protein
MSYFSFGVRAMLASLNKLGHKINLSSGKDYIELYYYFKYLIEFTSETIYIQAFFVGRLCIYFPALFLQIKNFIEIKYTKHKVQFQYTYKFVSHCHDPVLGGSIILLAINPHSFPSAPRNNQHFFYLFRLA